MTSLPKVQISKKNHLNVDLQRTSDLKMCAASLIHGKKPKTTKAYAQMIYSIQGKSLKTKHKHGHTYITDSWRIREEYEQPQTEKEPGDPVARISAILLNYLSPATRLCVEALLLNPYLLECNQ